jgi:biopolymer transport protein ExbD
MDAPLVSLIRGRAYVDAEDAGEVSLDEARVDRLPLVTRRLAARRENSHLLNPRTPTWVLLQVDRDAPAHQVKQLVASVAAAGYDGVSFLVRHVPDQR